MNKKTKGKCYFIAWDTDSYELDESVIPINLNWDCSIASWILTVQEKNIQDGDIVIGHSIGATVALLACNTGTLKLYSPSPIFKEAAHLLSDEDRKQLGRKIEEVENLSIKDIKIKPTLYYGSEENNKIKKSVMLIKKLSNIKSYIIKGADHGDVINHSGKIRV